MMDSYIILISSSADFLEEHRRVLESRLQPVLREITDSRARTREELESLYRKIVSAVLLRSGLGSPTDIAVVREATGTYTTVNPVLSGHLKIDKTKILMTNVGLMEVKSIAECSPWSILQYF